MLFPLYGHTPALPQEAHQVKIVSSLKYLGIWVYPRVEDYLRYNLTPILTKFKLKSLTWTKMLYQWWAVQT